MHTNKKNIRNLSYLSVIPPESRTVPRNDEAKRRLKNREMKNDRKQTITIVKHVNCLAWQSHFIVKWEVFIIYFFFLFFFISLEKV